MSVSPISVNSHSMNASYPKYLENKKRVAAYGLMVSGTLGTSVAALHFLKAPIAKKNPWLLATGAVISLLGTVISASKFSSASDEIKKMQKHSQEVVEVKNLEYAPESDSVVVNKKEDEKKERHERAINYMIMSNPVYNPTGAYAHAINPNAKSLPIDSPIAKYMIDKTNNQ